ncbi:MAG: hypothetical protein ACK4QL_12030, partial [Pseudanabaenaceae cyanobacterium]
MIIIDSQRVDRAKRDIFMNLNLNIFPLLSSFVIIPTTLLASEALVIPQVLTVKLNQNYVNRCPWGSGSRWIDGYLNGKR